jgi:hypothetical protein
MPWLIAVASGQAVVGRPGYADVLDFDGERLLGWQGNTPHVLYRRDRFGNKLKSFGSDRWAVCVWSAKDGRLIREFKGLRENWSACFLPTGLVAGSSWSSGGELEIQPFETTLRLWEPESNRLKIQLKDQVLAGFSRDGSLMATYVRPKKLPSTWSIALYNLRSGKRMWQADSRSSGPDCTWMEFSPDGKGLLVNYAGGGSELFDVGGGHAVRGKISTILAAWRTNGGNSAHFVGDQLVAGFLDGRSGGPGVAVVSCRDGSPQRTIVFDEYFGTFGWTSPARYLFSLTQKKVRRTDLLTGRSVAGHLPGESSVARWREVAVAPDGSRFAVELSAGGDQSGPGELWIVLFDGISGEEIARSQESQLVGFSPDGKTYVTRNWESSTVPSRNVIFVHDSTSGKILRTYSLERPEVK